jgi:hypothetical protein
MTGNTDTEFLVELEGGAVATKLLTKEAYAAALHEAVGDAPVYTGLHPRCSHIAIRLPSGGRPIVFVCNGEAVFSCHGLDGDPLRGRVLKAFVEKSGYILKDSEVKLGFITDARGVTHPLDALPEELHVTGDLNLTCSGHVMRWPRRIFVSGRLTLLEIGEGVEELVVGGDLRCLGPFFRGHLRTLPYRTHVGGHLYAQNTKLRALPTDFSVGTDLYLSDSDIEILPAGLTVPGTLRVSRTPLRELPRGLRVGGNLSARFTRIRTLPGDISVGGGLWLEGSDIHRLPEGFRVAHLSVRDTRNLWELPCGLVVDGDLEASGSWITTIPGDIAVGGLLDLSRSLVKTLPEGLTVGGDLLMPGTGIVSLPDVLVVGGKVDLRRTKIKREDIGPGIEAGLPIYIDGTIAPRAPGLLRRAFDWLAGLGAKGVRT